MNRLAIEGGKPVRDEPLRAGFHGSAEIDESEIDAVVGVLRDRKLYRYLAENAGHSWVKEVEDWYCSELGCAYGLAVNAGTSSLISALFGIGVGPGDEVIIPAYTWVSTAAAVIAAGAVPVIAEIDASLNMDPEDLERKVTPYTKAVVPVHMRGVPARMDQILAVANKHDLQVVEDVAQSNGGLYRGRRLGSLGHAGCFSFQQHKVLTSGEGGMLVTDDRGIFERARIQHDCAAKFWELGGEDAHGGLPLSGENYRMSELSAALVWVQRLRLGPILERCRAVKRRAVTNLGEIESIKLQEVPDADGDCGITLTFFLPSAGLTQRFSAALQAENIHCGTVYDGQTRDRHIYSYWPFMMSGQAEERRVPWKRSRYQGDVKGYSPEQCPQTLDHLSRAIMIFIDQTFTLEDADLIVEAVDKVAEALL